jgi:competence protein ComEA
MSLTRRDWLAIGTATAGATVVAVGVWLATGALGAHGAGTTADSAGVVTSPSVSPDGSSGAPDADLVVDVQGAVNRPGVVLLPPGSRVADALRAAGGYSRHADMNAAATALNLAAPLADGAQLYVPIVGVTAGPSAGGTGGVPGLVNLNNATPEELEALPGIGPVTVQKIVAARTQQPLRSLDEMVAMDIIDSGQLEDIRDLVTF